MKLAQAHSRRRSFRRPLCIAVLVLIASPLAFYGWFESRSRAIVEGESLDPSYRNALKHASAAGGSYAVLRTLGISGGVAEAGVLQLGDLNERAELVFKRGRRDTTAEIMKDLHNNMVGIAAAQWMERSGDVRNSVAILVALGHQGVLRLTRDGLHPQGDASGPDIAVARIWFDARRDEIVRNVGEALAQTARSGV